MDLYPVAVFLCLFPGVMSTPGKRYDDKRGSSAERGYGYRWQKAREGFLRSHPLCVIHERSGKIAAAIVLDHIIAHKGDMALFWDKDNWQGLCKTCHDSVKKRLEMSGRVLGCDANGIPADPNHHWHTSPSKG